MKHVFVLFAIILVLVPVVKSEEKSWYEIDGIRVRYGINLNTQVIYMPSKIESQISPFDFPPFPPNKGVIASQAVEKKLISPFALELPETLMTSWSFRGGLFEFEFPSEVKDLDPGYAHQQLSSPVNSDGIGNRRQTSSDRTSLYNEFFNASDKAFADANPNWALSADVTSSRIFLGYTWGGGFPYW